MKQPTIFLYCFGIDDVIMGSPNVAGIQVQMSFWAKTFVRNGWNVYSFSSHKSQTLEGIHFLRKKSSWLARHGMSIIEEPLDAIRFIRKSKSDMVFVRGGRRDLFAINNACRLLRSKLVFLGASDRDFEPGKELILGTGINLKLYHKALKAICYYITQNQYQADNLLRYYGRESIIIPNIWQMAEVENDNERTYAAVWVANLRRLKRAEWFINLAKQLPQYRFAIAGGVNEQDYYNIIKAETANVSNLDFLGPQSLNAVNELLSKSKLLVCSSEFEGFPNTFLQAWAYGVPVISTVNPSGFITEFGLGKVVSDENELFNATTELMNDNELYEQCRQNIKSYFLAHHDAETAYKKIMELIQIEK